MVPLISKKSLIGLGLGNNALTLVQLTKNKNNFHLAQVSSTALLPGMIQNGKVMKASQFKIMLHGLAKEMKIVGQGVVIALSQSQIYNKRLVLDKSDMKKMNHKMNEEVMREFPSSQEKWRLDFQILQNLDCEKIEMMLMAVQEKEVIELYRCVSEVLKIKVIEMDLYALMRLFSHHAKPLKQHEHRLLIYEFNYVTYLIWHDHVAIVWAQKIYFQEGTHFVAELQQKMNHLFENREKVLFKNILICSEHIQSNVALYLFDEEVSIERLDLCALFSVSHTVAQTKILPNLFAVGQAMRDKPRW